MAQPPYGGPPQNPYDPAGGSPPSGPPQQPPPPGHSGPGGPTGPSGPHGPYGSPPGGPHGPYGPNPYLGPEKSGGGRGCATAAVIVGAVVLLLIIAIVAVIALGISTDEESASTGETTHGSAGSTESASPRESPSESAGSESAESESAESGGAVASEHTRLPECGVVEEQPALAELVPDYTMTAEEPASGSNWEQTSCQWNSDSPGMDEDFGFAGVAFIRNDDSANATGAEHASATLERDATAFDAQAVSDIGEEAMAWYDDIDEVGCVGSVTANIYILTCYDAQTSTAQEWGTLPESDAIDAAHELAAEVVPAVETQSY